MRMSGVVPLLFLAVAAVPATGLSGHGHDDHVTLSIHHDGELNDCSDFEVDAGRRPVATAAEHLTASAAGGLSVASAARGGIAVKGWDGKDYDLLACKAAVGEDRAEAQARLAAISVGAKGGTVESAGPQGEDWMVYWIIRAPRGAQMDLAIVNGPLSVRRAEGRFTIHGANGPVSLDEVAGEVTVEVTNGPVAITNGGGDVRVRTENGPIAVSLDGEAWQGEGLDARAVNGPLSLEIAEGYAGGVRVESSGHAPWSCSGPCSSAERGWDDGGRQIEIGPRPARVRLSTVNGPVAIDAR